MYSVTNETEIQLKCVHVQFDYLQGTDYYPLKVFIQIAISLENWVLVNLIHL